MRKANLQGKFIERPIAVRKSSGKLSPLQVGHSSGFSYLPELILGYNESCQPMSAASPFSSTAPVKPRASRLAEFRLIPRIETYPRVVSFAQTPVGKAAVFAVFAPGFWLMRGSATELLAFLVLAMVGLRYRRSILALSPLLLILTEALRSTLPARASMAIAGLNLAVIAVGMFLFWYARRSPHSQFGRRPVLFLLTGFSLLLVCASAVASNGKLAAALWSVVGVSITYLWFIGYALIDRSATLAADGTLEVASLRPLWGSTTTPFPKGAAYLRKIEARDPQQLAVVQLKGLKLLLWAIMLKVLLLLWNHFFHGYLGIPTSVEALAMSAKGIPPPWHVRWESQLLAFFESILAMSAMGHTYIAVCRMAGFNALRNTYRPLSSTTVLEFFNRYYYYFKELLVDFFYYPAFLRYWKGHRRLRTIFATFAAVFFGNAFFHFTRDWQVIRDRGLGAALESFQTYLFYAAALATAITISQIRSRRVKPRGFIRGRLIPTSGVMLFYCLLEIFDFSPSVYPITEHFRFLAGLFFIRF